MTIPYVSGTISVTAGNAVVTGVGTGWQTGLVTGGMFGLDSANGNPVPILSIDSDTQLTLAKPWRGTTAAGQAYWIQRDTAYGQQSVANANALATIINELRNPAVAALAAASAQLAAGKVPRGLSATVMEMFTVTDFAKTFLDEPDAAGVRAVLAAQAALGFTPVQQGGGSGQFNNKLYFGWDNGNAIKAQVDGLSLGALWADNAAGKSLLGVGYQRLPSGLLIQWGYSPTSSGNFRQNFPMAFPVELFAVVGTMGSSGLGDTAASTFTTGNPSATGFDVYPRHITTGAISSSVGQGVLWLAVGR